MKISTILDKIDERQLFVPAFQREYVWRRDDAKQLIDSLIKEYPTGTMLTWETDQPPELKGPHKYNKQQGAVRLLLDGQQRVTTLYMLIRGEVPPYYSQPEILNDTRNLYVNVETLDLSYYTKSKMEQNPLWIDVTDIFQRKTRARDVIRALEEKGGEVPRELEDVVDDNMRKIELILDREFPEQVIPVKATIREAIDIFYKVNSSGVALTDAELALAQISGYWPHARELFKEKLAELKSRGFGFKLDFVIYVLLGCVHQSGSDMRKLHGEENDVAIRSAWNRLSTEVLEYVVNILRTHAYVDHIDEINSIYALVPIIVYCYRKEGKPLTEAEVNKIVRWFYYSQIRKRYVSQLPQKLDFDLRIITESSHPFDELLSIIAEESRLEIYPEDFSGRSVSHPLFGLMRWYLKSKGAICFTTGVGLRQNMGAKYGLENDHIFPYSRLKRNGYAKGNRLKYALAQEMTNRAILTQLANRRKSATKAVDYLSQIKADNPKALKLQCIPEDEHLWQIENYEEFLQVRREKLAKEMNAFLNGFDRTEEVEGAATLEEIIDEGESDELEFKATFRWDVNEGKINKKLQDVIVKTVAAFGNADGGTLLIGVNDDGEAVGLENDYAALQEGKDKFELTLRQALNNALPESFVARKVKITFPQVKGVEICQVDIEPANDPLVIEVKDAGGQKQEKFFVRSGNSSPEMPLNQIKSYFEERFK